MTPKSSLALARPHPAFLELALNALLFVFSFSANSQTIESPSRPARSGNRVISGVVQNAKTGLPLEEADVTLTEPGSNTVVAATTSSDGGQFSFSNLADGKYSLRASHRGYIPAAFQDHDGYSTAIVTGQDQITTGLRLTLAPQGVLLGTVSEDSGDPVPKARVSLYRVQHLNGIEKTTRAGETTTDDLGNYEFPNLAPGNYYVVVLAQPWYATHPQLSGKADNSRPRSPLDVAYPITYYADVTDSNAATPIPVSAGERISVNFALHPVPAVHLIVQVPKSANNGFINFPQVRQDVFGSTEMASPTSTGYIDTQPGAAFTVVELNGLAPGHYEVELGSSQGSTGRVAALDAAASAETVDLATAGQSLPELTGKLILSSAEQGAVPKDLNISLKPREGDSWNNGRVEPDGSFHMQGLHPGTYDVLVNAPNTVYAVRRIAAKGAKVSGSTITVGSDPIDLTLSITQSSATVMGFAKSNGKPAPGVFVLLVPAHFAADSPLPETDQSDSDGSFEFARVPPGEYNLIAIQEGWTLDWGRPEVLNGYLVKGQRVTIAAQAKEINLKDPIETQPK